MKSSLELSSIVAGRSSCPRRPICNTVITILALPPSKSPGFAGSTISKGSCYSAQFSATIFPPAVTFNVLVEFEPNYTPGLAFFAMQEELSLMLGRAVDLNTPRCLSRYFRDDVLREAEVLYAAS